MKSGSKTRSSAEQNIIIDHIIDDLEENALEIQKLLQQIQNYKSDLIENKVQLKHFIEIVGELSKILKNDDGKGSVLTRLAVIESTLRELKECKENNFELKTKILLLNQQYNKLQRQINELNNSSEPLKPIPKQETSTFDTKFLSWKLGVALIAGLIGIISSVIYLVTHLIVGLI